MLNMLLSWWEIVINIGIHHKLSDWEKKRVAIINGISVSAVVLYFIYAALFIFSPDKVTFWLCTLAFWVTIVTPLLTFLKKYEAAAYYLILSTTFLYCLIPIAKKHDGTEYILITSGIISMLLFRNIRTILILATLDVSLFFLVRYAQTVIEPFWYTPQSANLYNINTFLFILTLFLSVYLFRRETMQHEDHLIEKNKQLAASLSDLHDVKIQLIEKEKLALLGELNAGISHELQNPLNFVNNFSEISSELMKDFKEKMQTNQLSEMETLANTIDKNLQRITFHGQRATRIIEDMLAQSSIGTGEKRLLNFNELLNEFLQMSYYSFKAKHKYFNARLETSYDPKAIQLYGVSQDLGRLFLNLFNNAFYALAKKQLSGVSAYQPILHITTKRINGDVELRVKDNGTGISKDILDKIYRPFFTTKPAGEGSGLGLALSYEIVSKGHGGTIQVESTEGVYTEFIIYLPAGINVLSS
jgi:signal transduction histidine kinase